MSVHKEAKVLKADGWFAPAIELSNGHTVRGEFKFASYADALAAAEAWFAEETKSAEAVEESKPKKRSKAAEDK